MADHVWSVLCTFSSENTTTHNISLIEVVEAIGQLVLVPGHRDSPALGQLVGGPELVVVSGLAEIGVAWHDQHGLAELEAGEDRAHTGVGDHDVGFEELVAELARLETGRPTQVRGPERRLPDLGDEVVTTAFPGPRIDVAYEPVEWHLCADRHEDQRTDPSNDGPPAFAS